MVDIELELPDNQRSDRIVSAAENGGVVLRSEDAIRLIGDSVSNGSLGVSQSQYNTVASLRLVIRSCVSGT